ncbi:MAG TPA: rod-binding protein [Fimbriimonadaceae bacterium]|nr:rod-binding protein [Fimbriimonadaceae bacterium]
MSLGAIFSVPGLKPADDASTKQLRDLKKACEQFEAVFAKQLFSEMRKGIQKVSLGGDQAGSAIYQDMMDQTVADAIAKKGGLGIGQMLFKQFEIQVEAASNQSAQSRPASAKGDQ